MGTISLTRIDDRLIHGQVVTTWIKRKSAKRVIIIDDFTAGDAFMKQVLILATPVGVTLEVMSAEEAGQKWQENKFGLPDSIVVLFKSPEMAYKAYKAGFTFSSINAGSVGGMPGKVKVIGNVWLNKQEAEWFNEMAHNGCDVVFEPHPDMNKTNWKAVKAKFFSDLP